MIVRIV